MRRAGGGGGASGGAGETGEEGIGNGDRHWKPALGPGWSLCCGERRSTPGATGPVITTSSLLLEREGGGDRERTTGHARRGKSGKVRDRVREREMNMQKKQEGS